MEKSNRLRKTERYSLSSHLRGLIRKKEDFYQFIYLK